MSLNALKVPLISITPENEHDDNDYVSLMEALTDTENLDIEQSPRHKRLTKSKLKIKIRDEITTDLEDFEASDCEGDDTKIVDHRRPFSIESLDLDPGVFEETYKIKTKNAKGKRKLKTQSSTTSKNAPLLKLDDFEDGGVTDCEDLQASDMEDDYECPEIDVCPEIFADSINIEEKLRNNSALGFSPAVTPKLMSDDEKSPKVDLLTILAPKLNVLTDTELVYSDSEMEDTSPKRSKSKLRKRRSRGKKQEAATDVEEIDFSENESRGYRKNKKTPVLVQPKNNPTDLIFKDRFSVKNLRNDQDSDDSDDLGRPNKNVKLKRSKNTLQVVQIENEGLTDVDQCDFDTNVESDDCDQSDHGAMIEKLEEIASSYGRVREENSIKKTLGEFKSFDTIDTDFESETPPNDESEQTKSDYNVKFVESPHLTVPKSADQPNTDVESVYSSDDENYKKIPVAILKRDVDETSDESLSDFDITVDYPDVVLPEPFRKVCLIKDDHLNRPTVKILPLDQHFDYLKISPKETQLTDVENISDYEETLEVPRRNRAPTPGLPTMEGGYVDLHEKLEVPSKKTHEQLTDTEEVILSPKKQSSRKQKKYVTTKKLDVEYIHLSDESNLTLPVVVFNSNFDTDVEVISNDDDSDDGAFLNEKIDFVRALSTTPIQMLENGVDFVVAKEKCGPFTKGDRQMINTLRLKKRKSSSYSPMVTDTEDVTASADEDFSVSRAETATPSEMILRELDSVSSSRVQLGNYKKIDVDHPDEMLYVKYGGIRETYTDIEEVAVSDDEHKKNKVVLDFQQGSVKFDSRRSEWDASIKKGGDVPSATTVTTTTEEKLKDAAQEDSSDRKKGRVGSLTYESVLLMNLGHNNPAISPENLSPNDSSNSSKVSSYTQIDAMLERMLSAVEEQEKYFIDESDDYDDTCVNSLELVPSSDALIEIPIKKSIHVPKTYETTQEIHIGQFEQSPRENSANFDSLQENINNLLVEIKNDEEAAALLLENVSEDDDCHDDCLDDYEPIDIGSSKTNNIWYEGAYRNLSIVPEEDEDTNSTYSLPFPQKPFCEPYKTSSSDSSDYEEDVVKAEVKLLVKTSDRGNESIEIRSVREFMEKPIKSNSKKPVFTLQRLFVRTPETENDLGSSKNLSRSRSELLAAPTDNFPLKLNEDHIDLYANTPFYPCYTNPTLLTTFTTKPNDTNIPEGYCDWFSSEEQKQGISTTTRKYLDSDEDALINLDLKRVADKTNAFIKSELVAEPYDVNTDRYFKEVAARHAGSLTETADFNKETVLDEKKSKKGFFGTLRNIMGKSTDHSDSDSEKSPKVAKKEKKKKHKEKPKDKDKTPTETPTRKPKLPTPDKSVETEENVPVETKILKDQIDKEKPEDQKSPESKQKLTKITVVEEVTKTFQPAVVEGEQFSITVDPTKKEPEKKEIDKFTFNIDDSIDKIEKEILEKSPILSEEHITKPIINFDEQPTMTSKDDDYEDIEAPVISKPPDHLETLPEYITKTEDDLKTETDKKIKISDSPRTKQKQGVGLFKFLKKSSKDVEESDDDSKQEIIEKQDKELSKEKPRKTEAEKDRQKKVDSENEDDDSKKGGLFSIFTKKGKTVETSKDKDKAEEKPEIATEKITTSPPTEKQPPNDVVQEKSILDKDGVNYKLLYSQKSLEDMENTASFLKNEISVYEDDKVVAPKEAEKHVEVPKQEKEKLEETPPKTEEGEKKSIFSNLFGKKTKKSTEKESETEDKKSEAKTDVEKLSAECRKEMEDSCAFLETEIKNYEDKKDIVTTKMTEEENVEKTKTEQQEETIIVKKEVEEEDKKSFFTNIFGKKTKKSVEREIVKEETEAKDAKQPEITNYKELLSDECKKNVEDTNNFLKTEVENYEDSKISFSKEEIKSPRQEQEQQPQQQSEETHKVEDGEKKSIFSNIFGKKTKKSVEREIVKTKTEKDETKTEIETKEERKTEIPPLSEECKKNIKDSSDFLQTEIVNYEDVERAPPTSPEKQQKDAKLKEKGKEEQKSAVKSPEETKEEDGEKKSIFPSIFSKKTKKSAEREIVKTKPEVEEQQKKEMQSLSDECKKNIKDSSEFLQTEVANYEDSRVSFVGKPAEIQTQKEEVGEIKSPEKIPIKQDDGEKKSIFSNIFGKKSKKSVEREIVETKTEGDKAQPLTKPETVVLSEECKKDMEDTTKFLQNELINYEDSKPPLVTKEKEEKPQKVEDAQKSEEKEVKSPEEIVHKEDESEKKSIFSNIFGKKTKKSVEREIVKTKTDVEEAEKKKEGLSDECKKDMEDTTKFIKTEVDNYEDSKIIQECKIAQQKIEENVETKQEEIAHKEDTEKKSIFAGVFGKKTKKSVDKDTKTKTESDEKSPKKKITKEEKDKQINIEITVSDETKTKTVLDDTQNEIDKHEDEEKDKKTEKTAEEAPPKDDGEKKSILSNLLGKKYKKSTEKEAPKTNVEDETIIDSKKETYKQLYSEEFKKDLENVANFIQGEITNYEDGKSEISQQMMEDKKEKETEEKIVEKPKQELAKGTEEEEKKSLFSVFGKKTKKSVEREIVSTAKPEQEESKTDKEKSEEIDDNEKKDGFFGIFKKPKVEVIKKQSETVPEVSVETKPHETETVKEKTEITVTDVKDTEEQPQLELQTKLDDEDYDSSDSKSGGLFSFFSKKGKKESSPKIQKKKFKKHQKAKSVEDKEHRKSPKTFSFEETVGAIDVAKTTDDLMGGLKEGVKETVERIKDKTATVKDDLAKTAEETTTKTKETLADTADKMKDESKKGEDSIKEKMATEESKIKTTVTDKIEETYKCIEDEMKNLKETSDAIKKESVTIKETITEKVDKTSVDLDKDIKVTVEEAQKEIKHTSEIVESKKEKTEQFIQNGVDLGQKEAEKNIEKIKADVQSVDDTLQSKLDKVKIETTKTVQEIEKSVGEKTTVIKGEIEIKSDEIKDKTKLLEDTIKDNLKFATSGFTTTFQETGKSVKDKIEDTKEEISVKLADETKIVEDKISTGESVVKETILQTQKSVDDKIKKTAKMVEETVKVKSEEIKESVDAEKDKIKQAAQEAQKSAETVKDGAKEVADKLCEKTREAKDTIKESAKKQKKKTEEALQDKAKSIESEMEEKIQKIDDEIKKTKEKAEELSKSLLSNLEKKLEETKDFGHKTKDAIKEEQKKIATEAQKIKETTKDKLVDAKKSAEDKIKEDVKVASKEFEAAAERTKTSTEKAIKTLSDEIEKKKKDVKEVGDEIGSKVDVVKDVLKEQEKKITSATQEIEKSAKDLTKVAQKEIKDTESRVEEATKSAKDALEEKVKTGEECLKKTVQETEKLGDKILTKTEEKKKEAKDVVDKVKTETETATEKIKDALSDTKDAAVEKIEKSKDELSKTTQHIIQEKKDATKETVDGFKVKSEMIGGEIKEALKETELKTSTVIKDTAKKIAEETKEKIDTIDEKLKKEKEQVETKITESQTSAKKLVKSTDQGLKETQIMVETKIDEIKDKKQSLEEDAKEKLQKAQEKVSTTIQDVKHTTETAEKGIRDAAEKLDVKVQRAEEKIEDTLKGGQQKMKDATEETATKMKSMGESLKSAMEDTRKTADCVVESAKKGVEEDTKRRLETAENELKILMEESEKSTNNLIEAFKSKVTETESYVNGKTDSTKSKGLLSALSETPKAKSVDIAEIKQEKETSGVKSSGKATEDFISADNSFGSMTRAVSDHIDFMKDEDNTSKISETNIDLSNLPPEEDYVPKKQKFGGGSYVTSPTMQRRYKSTKLSTKDRPELLDISNMPVDSSSDEDNYIVTEPPEEESDMKEPRKEPRKPLFHLESEENEETKVEESVPGSLDKIAEYEKKVSITTDSDFKEIEKKLQDLDEALGDLENLEFKSGDDKKLRRVERKFERMASEVIDKEVSESKKEKLSTPEIEEKRESEFQKIVSQLSAEEVSECQKDYVSLWDEHTFSPSDEWDSKTPDSQLDAQELPQENSCGQLTELTPKPKPRTAKTPDETQETLEKETTESSVVDETLDYSERKKFWENFTKEKEGIITTKKRMSLHEEPSIDKASLVKKRTSVHEVSLTPPVPKPRHVLQTKDTKSIDESTESLPADVTDDSTKPISEYQASYQHPSRFSNAGLEKTDSLDSELEFSTQNQSCENTGYISDSGDVEHYISDSEIEDRVPQIRERQMSVCEPYPAARKTIYERSASLPTEDLYEVSARSAKLRKQYYEQQIKKEMIAENLMTESEDEPSPELKTLDNLQIKQEEPPGIRSVPEKATEDEKESSLATVRDLAKTFGGTILKKEPTKTPQMESEPLAQKDDSPKSVKDLAETFEKFDKAPKKGQKSSESDQSVSETDQDNLVKEDSVSKPSDSMEVHVDKSEIEDSEKLADLDQDATDLETKSLDSLNATETSPKLIASVEDNIPEITVTLSGKQRRISEESDEEKDQEMVDKKVESPINIPEEHVQDTIWEVSVESHLEEQATEMVSLETSKIDMKSVQLQKAPKEDTISPDDGIEIEKISPTHDSDTYTNDKLTPDDQLRPKSTDVFCETERDEEFSGSVRDESDLGSEIHQDHSDSYASDKIKSESHSDIEKIILESLHQQHVDPEEAKKIASALIEDIEKEIQKRNELELDLAASPEKVQVSDYLRQLAETKGLDQREVELVESVLARRQRELAKLARGDTQASSMEITDEDLRYSGAEIDYNNVLEQQIDQLEAEKSKTFDKIEEEINAFKDKTTTIKETDEEKSEEILKDTQYYEDGERKTHKIDMHKKIKESTKEEKTAVDSTITESKGVDRKQETIVEEHDETLSDTLREDTKTSASTIEEITHKTDTKKEIVEKTDDDKRVRDETITEKSLDESKILGGYTKEFSATSILDDGVKEVFEKETEEIKTTTSTKKDTQVENVLEIADDLEEQVEKTHTKISSSSTIVDHAQKESKTVSSKILGEIVEADLDKLIASGKLTVDQEKGDVMKTVVETHQEIKRTSSDESKSSQEESAKSPEEQFSTCSSGRKGDSDTVNKASEKHGVVLRKTKSARDDTSSSSSNLKIERKSGVDFDSSSGESHYQSFELDSGKSRPCSSDVEGLLAAGSSEYESALTSQDVSARSHLTSAEYHTAVSSLGSKESMRSLDSESSGNLASVEVSEASETLVPSTSDLDDFVEAKSDLKQLHGRQSTEMSDSEILEIDDSLNDEESKPTVDTQSKMKRSHEMTFQPEPKVLVPDSPQSESTHDIDERFGTSLDEGSVLSVSLSSTSSAAALRTVIELSRADSERLDGMTLSGTSDQITLEDLEKADVSTCTIPQPNDQISSVTMITSSSISENGVLNVSTQVSSQTHPVEKPQKEETTEEVFEPKKKGHRRYESTSFIPQMIPSRAEVERISELAESDKYTQLSNKEISSDEKKDIDESYETEADQGFHKDMREGRFLDQAESEHKVTTEKDETKVCQVRKLSGTSSEKSSFESEAEAEAAFSMVAHVSPAHKIKQICPILEDEDAEKHELETRERAQKEYEKRRAQMYDQSPGAVPDIKITQHMTPLVDRAFHYPDLELEEKEEALKETPETPASNSSKSSEETDQGREYVLDDTVETITESKSEAPTAIEKTVQETDSPNSDSFELIEKPDPLDDFVVIEEVAKEAQEHDTEGKSVKMPSQKYVRKHDEEVEELLVKSAPATVMTDLKYYPEGSSSDELGFEFEDSPPQLNQKQQQKSSRDYVYEYDRELEANKKWIEQQFQGDQAAMAAAGYGYEMDFERGPLEDIKEEDVNDFDPTSSRIGSLGSQKESGGSLGSVKDSFSSTPEYDVLAGRKYFTRSGEHDDVSMSSLQEFENLERAMSLENRRCHQGSQDSSSNGSFGKRYYASKSGQGDDVSVNSLKEFEGLEKACIAAHKIEVKVKEEEAMLAQIEEGQESIASESESCETISGTDKKLIPDSDEEDYEKRMFEIDEIIRQAQTNVERFIDIKDGDKTESIGRGDSFEEVSKVPDLDLDAPIARVTTKVQWAPSDDVMITSTDSLDLKQEKPSHHDSTDSLDQKTTACDIMTASTDSIEFQAQKSKDIATDSIETKEDRYMVSSDSLELATGTNFAALSDSIDEDGSRIGHDHSTSSTGRDFSSSVKEEIPVDFKNQRAEYMLGSTDSLDPSSSTATHATYQYETDSVYSGSFTSGGSNTMVSSTDTIDPNASHSVDLSVAVRKVWFDDNSEFTTEYFDDSSKPYVTEVIEPCPDDEFSHTIHRRVELPPEIRKITFRGTDADQQLQQFIENFGEGEHTQETEEVDEAGNVHVRKIVQKRYVVKTDEKQPTQGISKKTYTDSHGTKTIYTQQFEFPAQDTASAVHSLLTSIAGDSTAEESKMEEPATSGSIRAQATRRRQLRYDISLDDQTEVDPREHDWRFYLPQHAEGEESSGQQESRMTQQRTVADQHQLSEEMKELLKHMEEESKK